jgi:hypothetical protein
MKNPAANIKLDPQCSSGSGKKTGKTHVEPASVILRYTPAENSICFPGFFPDPDMTRVKFSLCGREEIVTRCCI